MKIYIGVDPGAVTGVSFIDVKRNYFGIEAPYDEAMEYVQQLARASGYKVHIGCEQYVQRRRQRLTEQPHAQRGIGVIKSLGYPVTLVPPSVSKKMCDDDRLRQLGWYQKTPDGHVNDAGRVLFATVALTSPQTLRLLIG